jgi:hypothetical protein
MFCSGCGQAIAPGQAFCPQCGRPAGAAIPAVPGFQFQLESYAGKIKALSFVWFIYAGLSLVTGIAGLTFARAFLGGHFGLWAHGPWSTGPLPPYWFGTAVLPVLWMIVLCRSALALATGWGLMEREPWGRVVAIVAAIFSLLKFPFGTALGIWTLVVLLGYRNSSLYEQL